MTDGYNLPPGLAPSGIPGWSKKDAAMDRAGEEVDDRIAMMAYDMEQVVRLLRATEGQHLDYTNETLTRSSMTLEEIQVRLDDCRHILGRVLND